MTFKTGVLKVRIVEVRFAGSGKISSVSKHNGDSVKKGEPVASLDRSMLQMELDGQLADYEKVRADFEIFAQKFPDPQDPIGKYLKTEKQAELNASVKDVELAKAKLDQCTLFSPVDGKVVDDSAIVPGLYITPAGSSVKIADSSSFYAEVKINPKDIRDFQKPRPATVKIEDLKLELKGETSPAYSDGKNFFVKIPVSGDGLLPGLSVKAEI